MLRPDQLSGPLKDSYSWKLDEHDSFIGTYLGLVEHTFSDQDINAYHPKLADSWRAFFRYKYSQNIEDPVLGREHAIAMYLLQFQEPIEFTNLYGDACYFLEVKAVFSDEGHPIVNIRGTKVGILEEYSSAGEPIRFVHTVIDGGVDVFQANLEAMYPGWEDRWKIGLQLGIAAAELAQQTFMKTLMPAANVDLSDLGDLEPS